MFVSDLGPFGPRSQDDDDEIQKSGYQEYTLVSVCLIPYQPTEPIGKSTDLERLKLHEHSNHSPTTGIFCTTEVKDTLDKANFCFVIQLTYIIGCQVKRKMYLRNSHLRHHLLIRL